MTAEGSRSSGFNTHQEQLSMLQVWFRYISNTVWANMMRVSSSGNLNLIQKLISALPVGDVPMDEQLFRSMMPLFKDNWSEKVLCCSVHVFTHTIIHTHHLGFNQFFYGANQLCSAGHLRGRLQRR